jgi:hypothetical protein
MVEAESTANANAALLEAQALDMRAVSGAAAPEILEYRFQQNVLDKLESVAERLPQVVQLGENEGQTIDFLTIVRQMLGTGAEPLFTSEDMQKIRERVDDIQERIRGREQEIEDVVSAERGETEEELQAPQAAEEENAERLEEIRQSVTDKAVKQRVERLQSANGGTDSENAEAQEEKG